MKFFKWLAVLISVSLPVAAFAQKPTNVAVVGPMTGDASAFGQQMKAGAELAVNDINTAGGVLGRPIMLDVEDDANRKDEASITASKIARTGTAFVAGHFLNITTLVASDVYAAGNVVQIAPGATYVPGLTERGLWNFARLVGRDDQQGKVAGNYIGRNYRGKNVAIVSVANSFGKSLADEAKKAMNAAGMTEKLFETYAENETDFSAILTRLRSANVDVVYMAAFPLQGATFLRQMRGIGMKALLVGPRGFSSPDFATVVGPLIEGTLFTFDTEPNTRPAAKDIVEKLKSRNIDANNRYALNTYAAFQVWAQAAAKARTTDARKVMATIKAGSWDTVIGTLEFDAKGDMKRTNWAIYKWDAKGGYAEIEPTSAPLIGDTGSAVGPLAAAFSPKPSAAPTQIAVAPPSATASPKPSAAPSSLPAPVQEAARAPTSPVPLGRRVALVIGNSSYRSMPSLANPKNDAADVAAALKGLGFETIAATDLTRAAMNSTLSQFSRAVRGADVALVYYSGHGMQFEGKNYLLPVDANLESTADVNRFNLLAVDDLIDILSAAGGMQLIVLDACRNNTVERDFKNRIASAAGGNRDVASTRGFSRIDARSGLIVTYSTAPGQVAADGTGRHSPFTEAFLRNVGTPDMEVRQMLNQVQRDVYSATQHQQISEISSLYIGPDIRLKVSANKP
jgi:branched-chain amino acid transport system substrate-binding protein